MKFSVVLTPRAVRDLRKLPPDVRKRITGVLESLANNPQPHGCERLKGVDEWQVRVGDYRVRYRIDEPNRTVTITRIGHRKAIYEG